MEHEYDPAAGGDPGPDSTDALLQETQDLIDETSQWARQTLGEDPTAARDPAMDPATDAVLDDTHLLIRDTWEWAERAFGEEEWARIHEEAAASPEGKEHLEDPAAMHDRFYLDSLE